MIRWVVSHRRLVLVLALAIIVVLALLGLKAYQLAKTARSLLSRVSQAQAIAQQGISRLDPAAVGTLMTGVRADVQSLHADARPLLWLAPYLGWLPVVGGDVQAAPALMEMADALTEAGALMWQGFAPLAQELAKTPGQMSSSAIMPKALAQLSMAQPQVQQAQKAMARATAARAAIKTERLSPKLANLVRKLDAFLPLAQLGLQVAPAMPEALGLYGPRTYLILAQNEDEIRPAGGYISAAGRMTFDQGKFTEFSFVDAKGVDDFTRPYPDPPEPFLRYAGLGQRNELWVFRDSNWSPDFPTSAKQAAYFYSYGQKVPVDGVVAMDQRAAQMLISAMGPVNIALTGTQMTVTGDNVVDIMREAWNPPGGNVTQEWMATRKGFIGRLAAAVRSRVEDSPGSVPWLSIAPAMLQALDERHISIYVEQPDLAELIAQKGWDGAIRLASDDYLMVVDANLGFSKSNAAITQSVSYTVDFNTATDVQATLRMDYSHTGSSNGPCQQEEPYGQGVTYRGMMNRCYYDYVRVYAPRGAQLRSASRQNIPASYLLSRQAVDSQAQVLASEMGKTIFAFFFVVESGKIWQTTFSYQLPSGIVRRENGTWLYSLWLQKQPNKPTIPTTVTVNLPHGAKLISATPTPSQAVTPVGKVQFEFLMAKDIYIEVRFRDGT